jgi:hypothetical protein
MPSCRIFVSYARHDGDYAMRVVRALKALNHTVLWDGSFRPGVDWRMQILEGIEQAHVVVAVRSEEMPDRPWPHQEIGYAVGCGKCVMPISFYSKERGHDASVPVGIIANIQAVCVPVSCGPSQLREVLQRELRSDLLMDASKIVQSVFRCDYDATNRADSIAYSAQRVVERWLYGSDLEEATRAPVMQQSAATSFSLPTDPYDANWTNVRDRKSFHWFRPEERLRLEELAAREGCSLIFDPCFTRSLNPIRESKEKYRSDVHQAKFATLAAFLDAHKEKTNVRVVVGTLRESASQTIIGDHWMAHSAAVVTVEKERQTISTWHAPTVQLFRNRFQRNFDRLFKQQEQGVGKGGYATPADYAVARIECALGTLCCGKTVAPRCSRCKFDSC